MNITFVCNEYPPRPQGGIGTFVYYLARGLLRCGHKVTVAGIWDRDQDYEDEGIRVVTVKTSGTQSLLAKRAALHRWLVADARNSRTDIVEVPDFDGMLPFRFDACPVVVRLHLPAVAISLQELRPPHPIRYFCERETLRRHRAWIGVSNYIARRTPKLFLLKPDLSTVIYNFAPPVVLPDQSGLAESLPQKIGDYIVYVGNVSRRKGAIALALAAKIFLPELPGLKLVYAGRDTLDRGRSAVDVVRRHLDTKTADRVIFTGNLSHQAVIGWVSAARVFVLPSWLESFGIAPVEAMQARVPVIYTSRASGPEVVDDGRTGLLVDPARPREIADAVIRIVRDRAFANRLAEQAFESVQNRFSLDTCIGATLAFYQEVLLAAKRSSPRP